MSYAFAALALASAPLLGIVTFVQLLYLESLRLRTRDLPALKFFKDTLEEKLGLETEQGAGTFSLIKHTLLVLLGIFCFGWLEESAWQAMLAGWLTMVAVAYALPQLLYRRTGAHWLLGLAPLLRAPGLDRAALRRAARILPVAGRPGRRMTTPRRKNRPPRKISKR